ncbi:hypothetical protein ACT0AQ_005363, partial [Escherichia coli]
ILIERAITEQKTLTIYSKPNNYSANQVSWQHTELPCFAFSAHTIRAYTSYSIVIFLSMRPLHLPVNNIQNIYHRNRFWP